MNLLRNVFVEENKIREGIDTFLDENGMISRENIPIIVERILRNSTIEHISAEETIIDSLDVISEDSEDQNVCSICIDILEDEVEVMDCTHKYHKECIEEWMMQNPVCPECRAYIKPKNEFPPLKRN